MIYENRSTFYTQNGLYGRLYVIVFLNLFCIEGSFDVSFKKRYVQHSTASFPEFRPYPLINIAMLQLYESG